MTNTNSLPRRALIVLTSHSELGSTGRTTGAYLAEITHVYSTLVAAGIEIDFVSPKGGAVPLDGVDRKDADNAAFLDDAAALARLHASLPPDHVEPSRYGAIYYAGGHGTMWDLPNDAGLARIAAVIYEAGGYVAAVCHGPAGLVNITLSNGEYLVAGKQVAAFTNAEEAKVGLTEVVPFLLASTLEARGAVHVAAPNFEKHVVTSERLITGQNPASARGVGEALAAALSARPTQPITKRAITAALLATALFGCAGNDNGPVVLEGFEQPEAVEWDDQARAWYVSNFGGAPMLDGIDKDGDGFISRVSDDGSDVEMKWITGLDAPKGMRLVGRTLWVVDVDQVLAIDVETKAITKRFPVADSIFLNDIDVAADGSAYVTDTLANTIFKITPAGDVSKLVTGEALINPNGIRVDGARLVVAGWGPITDPATFATSRAGDLYAIGLADKSQTVLASEVGNLDGLEVTSTSYFVTSWAGTLLEIGRDGGVRTVYDGFKSGADISRGRERLAVPELLEGTVSILPSRP